MTNSPHLQSKGTSLSGKVLALSMLPFAASLGFMCVLLSLSDSVVKATQREKTARLALAECNSLSFAMIKSGVELAELTIQERLAKLRTLIAQKRVAECYSAT